MTNPLWRQMRKGLPLLGMLWWVTAAIAQEPTQTALREALLDRDGNHIPDRLGETVTVEGVLTTKPWLSLESGESTVDFQDSSAGAQLRAVGGILFKGLEAGDIIRVRGKIAARGGRNEIAVEEIQRLGHGNVPLPRDAQAGDLSSEKYLGQLVRLQGHLVLPENFEAQRAEFYFADPSGKIRIQLRSNFFRQLHFVQRLHPSARLQLVGIVEYGVGDTVWPAGYYIRPREVGDFDFAPEVSYRAVALGLFIALLLGLLLHFYVRRRDAEWRAREITAFSEHLKLSEAASRESNQRLSAIIEDSPAAIVILDANQCIQTWNPAAERMFGWSEQEVLGGPLPAAPESDRSAYLEKIMRIRQGGVILGAEVQPERKDSSRFYASLAVSPLRDTTGQHTGSIAILEDITERKKAEQALQETNLRLATLLNSSPVAIVSHDADGKVQHWNPAAERLFGWTEQELLGQPNPTIPADILEQYRASRKAVLRGKPLLHAETQRRCKDGTLIDVAASAAPLCKSDGNFFGSIAIYTDLRERKTLQAQLFQAQKMEAVGTLAGGVAHDFNNLLNVIGGYSELLLDRVKQDDQLRRYVEEVRKAAERATSLTRQLLAFSRKQVLQPKVLDLNQVVSDVGKMLRRLIGEHIELRMALPPELGRVKADPNQLEQVLLNLAVNARDAMPQGGHLTIKTANVELDEAYVRQHAGCQPGPYVMLAVADTGVGMDAATRSRIFEPFFTTKPVGQGTGLGLATVYGIVKQSGGYIGFYSEPGRGTTFKVYLPRWEEPVQATDPVKAPPAVPQGSETVLLVEDEPGVRELAREFLEGSGYRVLEANHGAAALEIARRYPDRIGLVLSDVIMPGMGGRELADKLARLRPEAKILFMSGYTDDAIAHHGVLEPGAVLLEKPFTRVALLAKVRELLDLVPKC